MGGPLFSKASMVQLNMLYYYCEGPWVEQEEHLSWKMVKKHCLCMGNPSSTKVHVHVSQVKD